MARGKWPLTPILIIIIISYLQILLTSTTLIVDKEGGALYMESLFLAKLVGLTLVIISAAMLVNRREVNLLFGIYRHPEAVFLTGFLEIVLGLSLVLTHNIWVMDYPVIITIVGWSLLIRGIGRTFAPEKVAKVVEKLKKINKATVTGLLFTVLLLGGYLTYIGFTR